MRERRFTVVIPAQGFDRGKHRRLRAWSIAVALASLAIVTLLRERRLAEASLIEANTALSTLSATLEMRVQQRTQDLSVANRELTRQAIERERVTAELRQSEAWLRTAQRVAGVGSFLCPVNGLL